MQDTYSTEQYEGLLRRYDTRNRAVFDELIRLSVQRLTRLVHKWLAGEELIHRWQQTDDVLQNAAHRLQRVLKEVRPTTKWEFFSLAATMIRREILDMARQLRRSSGMAENYQSAPPSGDATGQNPLVEGGADEPPDTQILFREAADYREPNLPEIVELVFYEGMTVT